jgi:hypothetical protein
MISLVAKRCTAAPPSPSVVSSTTALETTFQSAGAVTVSV